MVKYFDWTESLAKFCSHILEVDRFHCYLAAGMLDYWLGIVSGVEMCPICSQWDFVIKRA